MKPQTRQRTLEHVTPAQDREAFTRLELAAVLAALGLLAVLVLPALASQRERSTRVLCVNNLRLAGQALQQWGTEHGGRLPWRTAWCEGGTQPNAPCPSGPLPPWLSVGINNNSWFQWAWISNELHTPRILACPSDAQKRPASTWGGSSNGGFMNFNYQNKAISYLAGLDVLPEHPDGLVAGDRNVRFNLTVSSCSSGIFPVPGLTRGPSGSFGIASGLHVEAGNFLFTDGRVEELSSQSFFGRMMTMFRDDISNHYLVP